MSESFAIPTVIFALNVGILALWLSDWVRLPGLIFYIILGVLMGPFFLNLVRPDSLGTLLPVIIELGVALIMFEGAIHLNISQYRSVSQAIRRLLTVGVLITVLSLMLLTKWFFGWPWGICVLFGLLMAVTGPTVIAPIIRKIPLKEPIGSILHWESILLEPLVVVGAILTVEFLIHSEITLLDSLLRLLKITFWGALVGGISGWLLSLLFRKHPPKQEGLRNLMMVALALLIFAISNLVSPDSGLLAVVFAGFIIGNSNIPSLYEIKQFKEAVIRVMIAFLFVLLSAKLNWNMLIDFSLPVVFLLVSVIFLIRPLTVFASLKGTGIPMPSKIFLSLTAPRGLVAASLASLLTLLFTKQGAQSGEQFEILAYQVIFVTVLVQSLWSKPLAKLLKVLEGEKRGFMIVGAHPLGVGLAQWMKSKGIEALLVDRDSYDIYLARKKGLPAEKGDALNESFIEELPLMAIGHHLALTSNDEVNTLSCQLMKRYFGPDHVYQVHTSLREGDESFLKAAGGTLVFPKLPPLLQSLDRIHQGKWVFKEIQGPPPENFIPLALWVQGKKVQMVTEDTPLNENQIIFGLEKVLKNEPS